MAATYTHHLFTKDVYQSLNSNIKDKLDINVFNLFGKSFDALFFYRPELGSFMHENCTNLYFAHIIQYLRACHETKNRELLSYLYGSLCHYVLDTTIHPYVYYFGGKFNPRDKKTYLYRGRHDYIEVMIDMILYQERNHYPIYKGNVGKEVFPKITFSLNLRKILDDVYLRTFQVKNGGKIYFKSYYRFKNCYRYFMNSRFGIKRKIYQFVDFVHIVPSVVLKNLCYGKVRLDERVLNLEHRKWVYPVDKSIGFHYSFYDLYDVAIVKAVNLITLIDENLDKNEKIVKKILREIGNLSYYTGVNENRKVTMKYFANYNN